MKTGNLYKHKNCRDLAIMPIEMFTVKEKGVIVMKVRWFNVVNPNSTVYMGKNETITVNIDDLPKWEIYPYA